MNEQNKIGGLTVGFVSQQIREMRSQLSSLIKLVESEEVESKEASVRLQQVADQSANLAEALDTNE